MSPSVEMVLEKLERQDPTKQGGRYYLTRAERETYTKVFLLPEILELYAARKISLKHPFYRGTKIYLERL